MSTLSTAPAFAAHDPFFPTERFAKVPAEALSALAHCGPSALSHAEFRVFVALCRHRGQSRMVYPTREKLHSLTGMAFSGISRATKALQERGWVVIHYADGNKRRKVENYELCIPVRPAKARGAGAKATATKDTGAVAAPKQEARSEPEWCSFYDAHAEPEHTPLLNDFESVQ